MAKQHKTAANTSNGPVAFKSLLKPWLHSSSGSKHLMFLFIYKRTSNDYVAWIVSVVYCEFKCAVQILPWIQYTSRFHVQSLQNQDKLRLMKRQTAHGLMWKLRDLAFAQKGRGGGRSTKWNCDVNLIAVKIETAAGEMRMHCSRLKYTFSQTALWRSLVLRSCCWKEVKAAVK